MMPGPPFALGKDAGLVFKPPRMVFNERGRR